VLPLEKQYSIVFLGRVPAPQRLITFKVLFCCQFALFDISTKGVLPLEKQYSIVFLGRVPAPQRLITFKALFYYQSTLSDIFQKESRQ